MASVAAPVLHPARSETSLPAAEIKYRADIDGLRALAVLPVVLFHYGASVFSGGFVGVDIFFVISGYLISGIIMTDLDEGRYSILAFYERRVRRILPALIALLVVCTIVSAFVLFPKDFSDYGKSLCATLSFLSNFYFWQDSDYFARAAETKPLLHTWSLGVEEQFYIVFPVLLWSIWRFGRAAVGVAAAAAFCVSLLVSIYAASRMPVFGFYLPVTRAYELLLGFFVAFAPRFRLPDLAKSALSFAGLAAILASIVFIDRDTPFPGWEGLVPTTGAALLILVGLRAPVPLFNRLLQAAPLTFFGKISYSLYLWHWPILVLYKYWIGRDPTLVETTGLFVLAVVTAYLSWRFVEAPFRNRSRFSRKSIFAMAGVTTALVFAGGAIIIAAKGLPQRFPSSAQRYLNFAVDAPTKLTPCFTPSTAAIQQGKLCTIGDVSGSPAPTFALWGDSHAFRLGMPLDQLAGADHQTGVMISIGGCPPLPGVHSRSFKNGCDQSNDAAAAYIESHPTIRTVILSAIWALYAEGGKYGEVNRHPAIFTDRFSTQPSIEENRRVFARTLTSLVEKLRASGRNVVIIGPVPELDTPAPETLARGELYGRAANGPTYGDFLAREQYVLPVLQGLSRLGGVTVLYPSRYLCDGQRCEIARQGAPLYMDDNHLSSVGLDAVRPMLQAALSQTSH